MENLKYNIELLRELAHIRFFEENLAEIYSKQLIRCPVHLAIGHEASAVGVCRNLNSEDKILSYHRSHHHFLARGCSPESLLYELLGSEKGCSGGRGGSVHLSDQKNGFVGSSAIISGILPVSTGIAHGLKIQNKNGIVVSFCGDATIEEGVFFESLNIAKLWKLPLLIVIEDNNLSCYTNKSTRQSIKDYSKIAELFEVPYAFSEGNDVEDIILKSSKLIKSVRSYFTPAILHVNVFRAHEHCGPDKDDHLSYRQNSAEWDLFDPLLFLKNKIDSESFDNTLKEIKNGTDKLFSSIIEEATYAKNF